MSESPTEGQELTTQAQAPRAVREYRVVENRLGIMDTARFEHLGRVATVLAKAGLLPESLTHAGPKDRREMLPYEVIQARAFLIANQADLIGIDPNALAQCTSFVHGKLMYEGKLVHALISEKLGIDLLYEFGTYDAAARDIREGLPAKVDDQSLGVRVSGLLPGELKPRWIAGSVAMWNRGAQSPWGNANAWTRQLRYMGAREWCRAYKPSLLLGILTDDEVDEYDLGRQVGQIAPAAPQPLHAGFSDQRPAQLIPPEPKPKATRGKGRAAQPEPEPAHDPQTGEILGGDDLPASLKSDEPPHAPPGAVYLMIGDTANEQGKLPTYKDGKPFSMVGGEGAAKLVAYAQHAPEVAAEPGPTVTDGAQAAEAEPASSGSATPASGASAEEISASQPDEPAASEDDEGDDLPPALAEYIDKVDVARDFTAVKTALRDFQGTDFWKGISNDQANRFRRNTWETMAENFAPEAMPDPAHDASAFRLWVEAQDDAQEIEATLSALESDGEFAAKPDNFKEAIRGAAQARIQSMEP